MTGHLLIPALGLAQTYLALGNLKLAREQLAISMPKDISPIDISILCFIEAADGNRETALECLKELLETNYRDFDTLDSTPHLETLRADPEYQALIKKFR